MIICSLGEVLQFVDEVGALCFKEWKGPPLVLLLFLHVVIEHLYEALLILEERTGGSEQ